MVCVAGVEAELMEKQKFFSKRILVSKRNALATRFIILFLVIVAIDFNSDTHAHAWTAPRMRKSSVSSCVPSAPSAFTWKGTTSPSWNTATNWHGGVVPGASDVAIFDNNCSTFCSPSVDAVLAVAGINMRCSWTGNVVMSSYTLTVGASGITMDGGTFTGGSGLLDVSGSLTMTGGAINLSNGTVNLGGVNLSGGTFGATNGYLDVGQGGWTQSGGTFNSTNGTYTITLIDTAATAFSLTGGTFNSPSGTFRITNHHDTVSGLNSTLFYKASAATFNHNNGTVVFDGRDSSGGSDMFTIDVGSGNLNLNNVTIDAFGSYGTGHRIPAGQTITVLNTFDHLGGSLAGGDAVDPNNWGEWILMGNTNNIGDGGPREYASYGTIRFKGTGNQTYACDGASTHGPHLKVEKPSGTLTTSSTDCTFASLELKQGSITMPTGTLSLNFERHSSYNGDKLPPADWTIFKIWAGTTFTHNNGTVRLNWRDQGGCCEDGSALLEVPSNFTFYNLTNEGHSGYWEAGGLKITSGSVIVQNNFKWLGGRMFDNWTLQGDAYMYSIGGYTGAWGDASGNGSATFTFSGTANQMLYTDGGSLWTRGQMSLGNITVNKSSGTLTLDDNFTLPDAAQNMTVTAGTVQMAGYNLSVGANLTIASGATVTCNNGVLTYGSLTNNGTLNCTPATHTFTAVGSIASAQSKTAAVNWSFAPSAQLNAGNLGVLIVSSDNYDTGDVDDGAINSVTDSVGNKWKKRGEWQKGSTGAGTGVIVSVWTTVATTNLTTGGTITVHFYDDGVGPTAKAATGRQFSFTGGSALHIAGYSTLAEAVDPSNMTLSGLASNPYLWIRAVGQENATTTWTSSTNYTAFTHTTSTTSGGVTATNIGARGEFRIFTGTTDSTNPTGVAADNASIYLAIQ